MIGTLSSIREKLERREKTHILQGRYMSEEGPSPIYRATHRMGGSGEGARGRAQKEYHIHPSIYHDPTTQEQA